MRSETVTLVVTAILVLFVFVSGMPFTVKAQQTYMKVINPLTGDGGFNFTSRNKNVGDTFIVNITVTDVTDLWGWQINFTWDASLLDYVNITLPSDHVFAGQSFIQVGPVTEPGSVAYGLGLYPMINTFNGSGRLCQVALRITQEVDEMAPEVSCTLALANIGSDTFMIDRLNHLIPFSSVDGFYDYRWVAPSVYPTLYIRPSVIKPLKLGDLFAIEVWVKDVDEGWSIIGFNFSLTWNTTFMTPSDWGGRYFDNGTFLEGFQYYPDGVSYVADINIHDRPPPLTSLPDDYNYSKFAVKLLPDNPPNPQYHKPFASGGGKLLTAQFRATYETISPLEAWTYIEFIQFKVDEDTYAVNQYMHVVGVSVQNCHYRAPGKILGDVHDIAVTGVAPSKSIVGRGYCLNMSITVQNQGTYPETFNVTVYANTTVIAKLSDIILEIGNSTTLTFTWNTTGLAKGNYTINGTADSVPGEYDPGDNTLSDGVVLVGVPCDVTSATERVADSVCNMRDIGYFCSKFATNPSSLGWDPNCDVTGPTQRVPDGKVDMRDVGEACRNFMKPDP